MPVDYDLVIIGATPAGIQAAMTAATLKARVALVTQAAALPDPFAWAMGQSLATIARQYGSQSVAADGAIAPPSVDWAAIALTLNAVRDNLQALHSPAVLAARGIDVIQGLGEFCRKPAPGLLANGRLLRSRAYLLALGRQWTPPSLPGLATAGYLTVSKLSPAIATLGRYQRLAIIGSDAKAIALAQALHRLAIAITLILPDGGTFPVPDPTAATLLQAQLEADGIRVIRQSAVYLVQAQATHKQIHLERDRRTVDEVIVADTASSDWAALNLEAMGVRWDDQSLWQTPQLQTSNPRIYVCEGCVNGAYADTIAFHEAAIAVKNALFWPRWSVNYAGVPMTLPTCPEMAWVGLSEAQARHQYGDRVEVLQRSFNTLPLAQLESNLTGFCKLIVRRNGRLLGAVVVGQQAPELIGVLALAIQQKMTVSALNTLAFPTLAIADILRQTANDWEAVRLRHHPWLRDGLDVYFDWRRSWAR